MIKMNGGMKMKCKRRCLIRVFTFGIFALTVLIARNFMLMDEARRNTLVLNASYASALEQLADAGKRALRRLRKDS